MTLPDLEQFLDLDLATVFPDGRFFFQFFPFRVMKENARVLFESSQRREFFASGVEFEKCVNDDSRFSKKDEDSVRESATFSSNVKSAHGENCQSQNSHEAIKSSKKGEEEAEDVASSKLLDKDPSEARELSQTTHSTNISEADGTLAFSCGSYYRSGTGVFNYHLDLYGCRATEECLKVHLRRHLERICHLVNSEDEKTRPAGTTLDGNPTGIGSQENPTPSGFKSQEKVPEPKRINFQIFFQKDASYLVNSLKEKLCQEGFPYSFTINEAVQMYNPFGVLETKC
jgi:hypothetical protein